MLPCIVLPRELTIYTVGELHRSWLSSLGTLNRSDASDDQARQIDAAAVEEIDAAGLQLLVALLNMSTRDDLELCLTNPSAPVAAACEALGLQALLVTKAPERAAR